MINILQWFELVLISLTIIFVLIVESYIILLSLKKIKWDAVPFPVRFSITAILMMMLPFEVLRDRKNKPNGDKND